MLEKLLKGLVDFGREVSYYGRDDDDYDDDDCDDSWDDDEDCDDSWDDDEDDCEGVDIDGSPDGEKKGLLKLGLAVAAIGIICKMIRKKSD